MKKPYQACVEWDYVLVRNARGKDVAWCYSKSMAKRIAAALNRDAEVKRMLKDGGF